jgi:hypothetical protein
VTATAKTSELTVYYDRATPVRVSSVGELDRILDQIESDPQYQRFPVLVSIATGEDDLVLDILVGRADYSFLVWHEGFTEIKCSAGSLPQDPDLVFNFGGTRTDAYENCLVPITDARAAVREFAATKVRPASVGWQTPRL